MHEAKIAVAQMHPIPGDIRANGKRILAEIAQARSSGAELIVFPELATSGYILGDRWEHDAFIREIQELNEEIRRASVGVTIVWGSVKSDAKKIGEDGRLRKYNAAFIAANGEWVSNGALTGWIPKTNLPKYRIFDDARHFYPGDKLAAELGFTLERLLQRFPVMIGGKLTYLALSICEDLWEDEYAAKISRIYGKQHADFLIDISASPWTQGKHGARDRMLTKRVKDSGIPILYVNTVGLESNVKNLIWFDGDAAFIGADGTFLWRAPQHEEGLFYFYFGLKTPAPFPKRFEGIADVHAATVKAIRAYYEHHACVVIGVSGGIDSAEAAALHAEALGSDRLLLVNMPTEFNSKTTKDLAAELATNLGAEYRIVPIQEQYETRLRCLADAGYPNPNSFDRGNIQARIRGQILADISACEGSKRSGRVTFSNNGNKTEVALNFFTLYGDGAGWACFQGDLWKGQIYQLAKFMNAQSPRPLIPQGTVDIVPSHELDKTQNVDEGKGDPIFYPWHDKLLLAFTETRWDPTTVLEHLLAGNLEQVIGCESGTIKKYFASRAAFIENLEWAWNQYSFEGKRLQLPPVFLTSRRAFGFDRRDTLAAGYLTEDYQRMKTRYLAGGVDI